MCYNVLLSNGEYIAKSTTIPIVEKDLNISILKEQMENLDKKLDEEIGDHNNSMVEGEIILDDNISYNAFSILLRMRS